ncbi:MAG TPA: DUF1345 domain-containing protein [Ferruginibacter sp.]|nr:DUF1345 domain-containing protein [Ferruginibacter sp.]
MGSPVQNKKKGNIFLRMHPLQRILFSLAVSVIVFFVIQNLSLNWEFKTALLWDAFSLSFITCCWIVFFTRPVEDIVKQANKEDGSKLFVMISILVSSFASLLTVLLLMISKELSAQQEIIMVILSVLGMMVSWMTVHTIFTFHYAHMYYFKEKDDTPRTAALDFPGKTKPNYLDFAYFSFVIGMTFQVSDVQVSSPRVRRTVLAHALLAFILNTFVVALTINLIAGLRK